MIKASSNYTPIPLNVVGSSTFGRYPKISKEETWNNIISDGCLVPFAGYTARFLSDALGGRETYTSTKGNLMISVIDNFVYKSIADVNGNLITSKIDNINTFSGDVFIAENNNGQIAICDKENIYVYNYINSTFTIAFTSPGTRLDFTPLHIAYQDTRIVAAASNGTWRLSLEGDATKFPADAQHIGFFQTKGDSPLGVTRIPGKGNMLLVMGSNVSEPWYDLGLQLFPYQKDIYNNIDYGVVNQATIASLGDMVVWLSRNEQSAPAIMFTNGSGIKQISTDGINFKFANLKNPNSCFANIFRQDGHVLYILNFYKDNFSIMYDFNTSKFFHVSDHNFNSHIAKSITYFNNKYYFVSFKNGNIYEMSSSIYNYDGNEIPRVRITESIRIEDSSRFCINSVTFTMEQGENNNIQVVDYSISIDGGESFSNSVRYPLNPIGKRQNRFICYGMGSANDFISQFRFYGDSRFIVTDGVINIYQ